MSLTRHLRVSRVDVRLKKASLLTLTALVRLAPAKLGGCLLVQSSKNRF